MFAAANSATGLVAAVDDAARTELAVYRQGEPLLRYKLARNVRKLAVSANGMYVLATDATTAHLLTPGRDTPLWSRPMPVSGYSINSVAVTDSGVALLGAQHDSLRRGIVLAIDRNGRELYRRDMAFTLSNAWIPTVQVDRQGSVALLRSLEELVLIRLPLQP
jgi:hypothetical protein